MSTQNKFKKGFVKFKDLYEYVKSYVAKYLELQYKGAWNASTNTPTLADGVGNNGDFYRVSVAGTQNLGSGSIEFTLGDEVRYNEALGIWQKFDTGVSYVPVNKAGDTMTGNLGFSGNGRKITADMSNATRANRFAFQTSTTNGNTRLGLLPNGTSTLSGVDCYAGTDPDNANFLQVHADGAGPHVGLNSAKTGTGTTRDLVFQIDGTTQGKFNAADGKFNLTTLTASQLTATDASKNFQSLDTATYPSLTEISYVKGVTSAIQTQLNAKVNKAGDTMTGTLAMSGAAINEANFVTVASATTCDIGAAASNNVAISGTTTITSFGTAAAGVTRRCRATGAFLITYNGTSLITANGKNIVTKADDCFTMTSLGSGNWVMISFKPADGRILANAINNQTGTSYTVALIDIGNDITLFNASAITTTLPAANTFPIGAKIKVINLGVGVNTFVKTGTDILIGNTTLIQYGVAELEVLSSNTWQISYATATIVEQASVCIDGTLTNDKVYDVFSAPDNVTIIGFSLRNTSAGTAGTYTARINGTNITGLVGIANTITRTNTAPTAANTMTYQQVLQYVPTGMTSVVDAFITVFYTRQY